MGVCEVKEVSKNRFAGENTVYDERMGPIDGNSACKTCKARSEMEHARGPMVNDSVL